MLNLKRIAITGSIASGKTTVCQFFEQWGACIVNADRLLHCAFSTDTSIGRRIHSLFGNKVFEGNSINRTLIAKVVASEPNLLTELEEICHPYVNREIHRHYREASRTRRYSLFVAEIPLLFESRFPLWQWFDAIVVVVSERKIAKERYKQSSGTSEQFDFREARQMPPLKKMQRANYIIVNNESLEELKNNAKKIFDSLKTKTP
jgi:dephospho-CoA kinase